MWTKFHTILQDHNANGQCYFYGHNRDIIIVGSIVKTFTFTTLNSANDITKQEIHSVVYTYKPLRLTYLWNEYDYAKMPFVFMWMNQVCLKKNAGSIRRWWFLFRLLFLDIVEANYVFVRCDRIFITQCE